MNFSTTEVADHLRLSHQVRWTTVLTDSPENIYIQAAGSFVIPKGLKKYLYK